MRRPYFAESLMLLSLHQLKLHGRLIFTFDWLENFGWHSIGCWNLILYRSDSHYIIMNNVLAFLDKFLALTIVLHSKPDLAVFGASMAGACVGFLLHNRYKASVFMGDTGSLALGAALAAMAACTGMFFPLFVASGIFVMEASSVIMQVHNNFHPCFHSSFSTSSQSVYMFIYS